MEINEIIKAVNDGKYVSLWEVNEKCKEFCSNNPKKVANGLDVEKHRWYETSTTVYKIGDRYIGLNGVSQVYSISMGYDDCCVEVQAFEMEKIKTITYKPIL